jgi:hypothetical protein
MGVGIEIGKLARGLFPDGVLVENAYWDVSEAIRRTDELIRDPKVRIIFEACFSYKTSRGESNLIRVDILERLSENRWRMYEVKSSTKIKPEHLDDMAFQAHIIAGCGLELADIYHIHVNPEYRRNGKIDLEIFRIENVTGQVIPYLDGIAKRIASMHAVIAMPEAPAVNPNKKRCNDPYECERWAQCTACKPFDWVEYLPRFSDSARARAEQSGIDRMVEIPHNFKLTPTQQKVVDVTKAGTVWRSRHLGVATAHLLPPVSYLDFETFNPGLPLYAETSPYQRIPFQWSLHHDDGSGDLAHSEFLAEGTADPRREFTETLLAALEGLRGPILVWSSFEASVIRDMARLFPDLGERLHAVLGHIVDLLPICRDHVYDPAFRGSYSIKSVLPAVAPDLSYDDLDIGEGGDASAAYYQIAADTRLTPEARTELRQALLKYCARDTLALVRVHRWLLRR